MPYVTDVRTECDRICAEDPLMTFTDAVDPIKPVTDAKKLQQPEKETRKSSERKKNKSKNDAKTDAKTEAKTDAKTDNEEVVLQKPKPEERIGSDKPIRKTNVSFKLKSKPLGETNVESIISNSIIWERVASLFDEEPEMVKMEKVKTCFSEDQADDKVIEPVKQSGAKYPITEAQRKKRTEALRRERADRLRQERKEKQLMIQKLKQLKITIEKARSLTVSVPKVYKKCNVAMSGKKKVKVKCPSQFSISDSDHLLELEVAGEEESESKEVPKIEVQPGASSSSEGSTSVLSAAVSLQDEDTYDLASKVSMMYPESKEGDSLFDPVLRGLYDLWDEIQAKKKIHPIIQNEEVYEQENMVIPFPKFIQFIDFEYGTTYCRILKLRNMSKVGADCVFYNVSPAKYGNIIKVEQTEALKIAPGISGNLIVSFLPTVKTEAEVKVKLLIVVRRSSVRRLLVVPVFCIRALPRPKILTTYVRFPKVYWWAFEDPVMNLEFCNDGGRVCQAFIESVVESPTESFDVPFDYSVMAEDGEEMPMVSNCQSSHECAIQDVGSVLEATLDAVFDPFRMLSRLLILQPHSRTALPVSFDKRFIRHSGLIVQRYTVRFEGIDLYDSERHEFILECDVEGCPLSAVPSNLILGHAHLDSYICGKITLSNSSKLPYPVLVSLPSAIRGYVTLYPTSPSIPPRSSVDIIIKLLPRVELFKCCDKYFDPSDGNLDFPIKFTPKIPSGLAPPFMINVRAVVSPALGLQILPKFIELGIVSTLCSIRQPIFLLNYSNTDQHFGFLSNHPFVQVQPNYGFGIIWSGEKLELELVYSPTKDLHPPWNPMTPLLQQKLETTHSFQLQVTTQRALSRVPRPRPLVNAVHQEEDVVEISPQDEFDVGSSETMDSSAAGLSMTLSKSDTKKSPILNSILTHSRSNYRIFSEERFGLTTHRDVDPLNEMVDSDFDLETHDPHCVEDSHLPVLNLSVYRELGLFDEKSEDPRIKLKRQTRHTVASQRPRVGFAVMEDRKPNFETATIREGFDSFHKVTARAFVSRTFYELSHQFISLETCPLYSYRIIPFYLVANRLLMATIKANPNCALSHKHDQISVRYEFFPNDPQLQVQPKSGILNFGQDQKLFLIYRPILSVQRINDYIIEQKEKVDPDKVPGNEKKTLPPAENDDSLPKDGRSTKMMSHVSSRRYKTPSAMTKEFQEAKFHLTTTFVTEDSRARIRCLIQYRRAAQFPATTLEEVHDLEVSCGTRRPDLVLLCPDDGTLDFGKVAVGSRPTMSIIIRSFAPECISITTNHVDPLCPFYLPLVYHPDPKCSHSTRYGLYISEGEQFEIPVKFIPEQPNKTVNKYFEIICGLTSIPIQLKGCGIVPMLECNPSFSVMNINMPYKSQKEVSIHMRNMCDAQLGISFLVDFMKEGPIMDFRDQSQKHKGGGKTKPGVFTSKAIDPSLYEIVFNQFKDVSLPSVQETLVVVEPENGIVLEPGKKSNVSLTFSLEEKVKNIDKHISGKKSRRSEVDFLTQSVMYAIRVKILQDKVTLLRDWLIFVTPTKRQQIKTE